MARMRIDAGRLAGRFERLGRIGRLPDGGYARFAYTAEEREARETVEGWMKEAGLETRLDPALNLYGRLPGRADGPVVLTGSHLDSVPHGGNFDGPAGVLCALEALQTLRDNGFVPEQPIEIVAFQGEEGSRFPIGLLGSAIISGAFDSDPAKVKGRDGLTLADALREAGGNPDRLGDARIAAGSVSHFVELHIEQSGILESKGLSCGCVTRIAAMKQFKGSVEGRADHAGAAPMELRRDALLAVSEFHLMLDQIVFQAHPTTRGTIGMIRGYPGATNIVAARAEFTLDVRDQDDARLEELVGRIQEALAEACRRRKAEGRLELQHASASVLCDARIKEAIAAAGEAAKIPVMAFPSGAVHDASNLSRVCPIGMIFVRSRDGISHSPDEYSSPEDLADGAQLLMETLVSLATRPGSRS